MLDSICQLLDKSTHNLGIVCIPQELDKRMLLRKWFELCDNPIKPPESAISKFACIMCKCILPPELHPPRALCIVVISCRRSEHAVQRLQPPLDTLHTLCVIRHLLKKRISTRSVREKKRAHIVILHQGRYRAYNSLEWKAHIGGLLGDLYSHPDCSVCRFSDFIHRLNGIAVAGRVPRGIEGRADGESDGGRRGSDRLWILSRCELLYQFG